MSYKIKINDLKKAIQEAAEKKAKLYENISFVDRIFRDHPNHIKKIKKIVSEKKDNGKFLYSYLLNECGCSSKYSKMRDYVPDYEDEVMLYDIEEDWDEEGNDDMYDPSINPEYPNIPWEDDGYGDDFPSADDEERQVPKHWVAEKMNESGVSEVKKAIMKGMSESEIKRQVEAMEERGYSVKAFRNEQEMNHYLNEDDNLPPNLTHRDLDDYFEDQDDIEQEIANYPLLKRLYFKKGEYFIEQIKDDIEDGVGKNIEWSDLEVEMENIKKYGTMSSYDDYLTFEQINDIIDALEEKDKFSMRPKKNL